MRLPEPQAQSLSFQKHRSPSASFLIARQIDSVSRKSRVLRVFARDYRILNRPIDSNRRIVPLHATVVGTVVKCRALVDDISDIRQNTESVREAGRNPHREKILIVQLGAKPFAELW